MVESVTKTMRQQVFDIQQMTPEMIQCIPKLLEFHAIVKESGLKELLWRVVGGVPMKYHEMWKKVKE